MENVGDNETWREHRREGGGRTPSLNVALLIKRKRVTAQAARARMFCAHRGCVCWRGGARNSASIIIMLLMRHVARLSGRDNGHVSNNNKLIIRQ